MKREPDMDSAAYRDKKINEEYQQRINPKRPTEGQLLGESGDYLKDPETEVDTSQPLQSKSFEIDPNRKPLTEAQKRLQEKLRKRAGTGQQGADLAREKLEKKGGSATDLPQFLQMSDKDIEELTVRQNQQRDALSNLPRDKAIEEVIKSTEPKSQERLQGLKDIAQQLGEDSLGYGLMALQKYGEAIDWTNDQVNLRNSLPFLRGVETPIDALLDYSYKDLRDDIAGGIGNVVGATTGSETANAVAETGAQIFLPDAVDFATGGVGYLDNIGRAALKLRKADGKFIDDAVNFVDNLVFQIRQKLGGEGNLELAGIGMRINKNNVTDTFYQSKGVPKGKSNVTNLPPQGMSVNNNKLFKDLGFEDWEKYFVGAWEDLADPIGRNFSAAVSNDKYSINTFNRVRRETLPLVMEEYAGIADIKWPRKGPELHHINAIKATMPLFEGLARNERKELLKVLMREGIYAGHDPNNLIQLPHAVHKSVTKLWNDKIGKSGKLFFERDKDGLFKAAQLPFEERKILAKNYAQVVKDLELTTLKMATDYKAISKDGLARKLDKELKTQFNIANFENFILTGKYLGDEVSPEVKQIFKSRSVKNIRKRVPKKKIDE
jgi:hypothetical protein